MNAEFTQSSPSVWCAEMKGSEGVVARFRVEVGSNGRPSIRRALLLSSDGSYFFDLLEASKARWPTLTWTPTVQNGDVLEFERFCFSYLEDDGPYVAIGVLPFGVVVPLGIYELTAAQMDYLTLNPADYLSILGPNAGTQPRD